MRVEVCETKPDSTIGKYGAYMYKHRWSLEIIASGYADSVTEAVKVCITNYQAEGWKRKTRKPVMVVKLKQKDLL